MKIEYRIRTCPELTLGLFEVDEEGEGSILAMIHGTRTSDPTTTDKSMSIGSHEPDGPTVALHTLCVHPGHRARGLGTRVLKEYLERVGGEKGVRWVTLIAHDELLPFYER
jgi:GNAT superfamily N-acetyltransferase